MNDKDKEAFTQKFTFWINHYPSDRLNDWGLYELMKSAWQAACDYKQKEIDELEKEKDYLCKKMENMRGIYKDSEKLQAENAKLKEQDQIIGKEIKTYIQIAEKLQAENAELKQKLSTIWKEAEKFYLDD